MAKKKKNESTDNSELARVNRWFDRLTQADRLYDEWTEFFRTDRLEEYYKGKQWSGHSEEEAQKAYTINMVYASMETNKPSLSFGRPEVKVTARPRRGNDEIGTESEKRAWLYRDTIQTFIDDPDVGFLDEAALCLHEAHFRYGIMEVGYSANYLENPDVGKPILDEDGKTPLKDDEGKDVLEPEFKVEEDSELLYLRRIPAKQFRVSISSRNSLSRNDWVGYFEWVYLEDVKSNKAYANTEDLKESGSIKDKSKPNRSSEPKPHEKMVKLWKIWDIRRKVRHVLAEGHKKFLQESVPYKFLPFAVLKMHEQLDDFYPMPPISQWVGPQDEVNETRDSQRAHRRRFYRRFTYIDGTIDQTEIEKLENGGDGVYAKANAHPGGESPLVPVPDAPLSADVWRHLDESKTDFLQVSGVTQEQRGIAESETATQATIIDVRARLRESAARARVNEWLAHIARLILLTVRDKMVLPFWIARNVLPGDQEAQMEVAATWEKVMAEDLGDMDFDVTVEMSSMSPVTEDMERNSWNQVLAILTNMPVLVMLSKSATLMRKTLSLYGIKSERDIREIMRVAAEVVAMMEQQQQQQQSVEAAKAGIQPPAPGLDKMLQLVQGAGAPTVPGVAQ